MVDSVWKRWLIAAGLAVAIALGITALLSRPSGQTKEKKADAFTAWKTRTGVDLAALPRLYPPAPDSEAARNLDLILRPAGLHLGNRATRPNDVDIRSGDEPGLHDLRDALRAEIRFESPEVAPFPPTAVSLLERFAPLLDAVAAHAEAHDDIRWYEDFGPRPRDSTLILDDHLWLHRLLVGRAYLALQRDELDTARRMLRASIRLNDVLAARRERLSQFTAAGIERLQLALLRRGGERLGVPVKEPDHEIDERFLAAMSAEAAVVLANSSRSPFSAQNAPGEAVIRAVAGGSIEIAASEAVSDVSEAVAEIMAAPDPCAELKKDRRVRGGVFTGDFYMLNATEAWRRFVVLSLDRAITRAALTGHVSSPCASVSITVRDDGTTRTVEARGLPPQPSSVIRLPEKVTVPLKRGPA